MAIKFVYANGDSYVHGQGLDDTVQLYDFSEPKRHFGWPGVITSRLGLDPNTQYMNAALPGASNDRIFRTTIKDVSTLIKQQPAEEILVIIGLSEADRTEVLLRGEPDYRMFLKNCPPFEPPPELKRMFDLRSAYYVCQRDNEDRFFSKLLALQFFLKSVGVKYIFTKSIAIFPDAYSRELLNFKYATEWGDTISLIDFERFYSEMHFAHFININNLSLTKCRHTGPDGHSAWAEHILDFIRENYDGISKQFVA